MSDKAGDLAPQSQHDGEGKGEEKTVEQAGSSNASAKQGSGHSRPSVGFKAFCKTRQSNCLIS